MNSHESHMLPDVVTGCVRSHVRETVKGGSGRGSQGGLMGRPHTPSSLSCMTMCSTTVLPVGGWSSPVGGWCTP